MIALVTAMDRPLGRTAGNAVEVQESVEVLAGGGPADEPSAHRAAAFGAIVAAYADRLCKYVYRYVRSREVAEDLVQEVFLRLWERGDELAVRDPLPYLYRAVHNRAIVYLRHQSVHERWQARVAVAPVPKAEGANIEVERAELVRALDRAIADLPERCRQVFTMSREQGLSHAEIARILGLSVKTVESHIWRAMTTLRASVAPYL